MYKPIKENVEYAKHVYDTIIKTQVFNPKEVVKAYKGLVGIEEDVLVNQLQAKQYLFNFFYYKRHLELLDTLFDEKTYEEDIVVSNEYDETITNTPDDEVTVSPTKKGRKPKTHEE